VPAINLPELSALELTICVRVPIAVSHHDMNTGLPGVKPKPVTETMAPAGPLVALSVIDRVTWKVVWHTMALALSCALASVASFART
jgi:hypothetical protein